MLVTQSAVEARLLSLYSLIVSFVGEAFLDIAEVQPLIVMKSTLKANGKLSGKGLHQLLKFTIFLFYGGFPTMSRKNHDFH